MLASAAQIELRELAERPPTLARQLTDHVQIQAARGYCCFVLVRHGALPCPVGLLVTGVLRVGDLVEPLGRGIDIQRQMGHWPIGRRTVPVAFTCLDTNGAAGGDLLDRLPVLLNATSPFDYEQQLYAAVCMPGRAGRRLKRDPVHVHFWPPGEVHARHSGVPGEAQRIGWLGLMIS